MKNKHVVIAYKNLFGKLDFYDPQKGEYIKQEVLETIKYEKIVDGQSIPDPPKIYRVDDCNLDFDYMNEISIPNTQENS